MSKFTESWTDEVNGVLNRIRLNSIELSECHRINSFESKSYRKYFDIPTIILSTMASSFAIGATKFVSQHIVSLTNCGINMFIAMLHSMKLYLNLDETFKNEQESSRSFEYLALELSKTLRLRKEQRNCNGLDYLNKIYSEYIKLKGNSKLLSKMIKKDFLLDIDKKLLRDDDNSYSENYSPDFITFDDVRDRGLKKKGSTLENLLSPNVRSIFKKQTNAPINSNPQNSREQTEKDLQKELDCDLESGGNEKHIEMTHIQSSSLDMNYVDRDKQIFSTNARLPSNNIYNDNKKNMNSDTQNNINSFGDDNYANNDNANNIINDSTHNNTSDNRTNNNHNIANNEHKNDDINDNNKNNDVNDENKNNDINIDNTCANNDNVNNNE